MQHRRPEPVVGAAMKSSNRRRHSANNASGKKTQESFAFTLPKQGDKWRARETLPFLDLPRSAIRVALVLVGRCNVRTGQCNPAADLIANDARVGRTSVFDAINVLCGADLIHPAAFGGFLINWAKLNKEYVALTKERNDGKRRSETLASANTDNESEKADEMFDNADSESAYADGESGNPDSIYRRTSKENLEREPQNGTWKVNLNPAEADARSRVDDFAFGDDGVPGGDYEKIPEDELMDWCK
jgi:hypothetical protein